MSSAPEFRHELKIVNRRSSILFALLAAKLPPGI